MGTLKVGHGLDVSARYASGTRGPLKAGGQRGQLVRQLSRVFKR
jgi:hypothetical protein